MDRDVIMRRHLIEGYDGRSTIVAAKASLLATKPVLRETRLRARQQSVLGKRESAPGMQVIELRINLQQNSHEGTTVV